MSDKRHFERYAEATPFGARTAAACRTNAWRRWDGYSIAETYHDERLEYYAIRNTCGVFDLSPMRKYRFTGPDTVRALNRLMTRDVAKIGVGRVGYTVWCDDAGHVLDDGTLFRFDDAHFMLCCQERQLVWLRRSMAGFDVALDDISEELCALAVQGPTSCAALKAMGLAGIEALKPFRHRAFDFAGGTLTVSRTGFTGDLGYELWTAPARAEALWDALMAAGAVHGIEPIGSAALEIARIEAGFIATNVDYIAADQTMRTNRGRSPFELGLDWLVDFDNGHFTGRRALLAERQAGSRHALVGLDIDGNKPATDALVYHARDHQVGHVTSALWSPTCKRNLALATLTRPYGIDQCDDLWVEIYVQKELKWERQMVRARVVDRPFFDPPRRRATPPADR